MLPEILQNPEEIFKVVQFLPSLEQTPLLVVTKTWGWSRNCKQNGDKSVCITLILKMSYFEKQVMSQFFQTQIQLWFSKFQCYPLPVITLTQTLVGWSDILSLINTNSSIPALKTLLGKVFPRPFIAGWVWSPLSRSMVKQGGLTLCNYIRNDIRNFGQ